MLPSRSPDAPAVITPEGMIAWRDWETRIDEAARALAAQGGAGGVVAFVAREPVEAAALILGALRAGVVAAPLSARLPPAALADTIATLGAVMLGDGRRADPARAPAGAAGVVVHTSGSMGVPRAALLSAESILAGAATLADAFALREVDVWLLDLPLSHVAGVGVVVRCAVAGAALAVPRPGAGTVAAIREADATHVSLVGAQLFRALRDEGAPPTALRLALLGGGPAAPALLADAVDRGWPVANSYGLTEMGSTVTATQPGVLDATAGRPLPGRTVRVSDGRILVGGEPLFDGYLDAGRAERHLDDDGLFDTGDIGELDDTGRLTVAGRADSRFVSGGENVQPEEIEAALAELPDVVRAIVVPVPDPEFGHRGVAFVETATGAPPDAEQLSGTLSERLPRFMVPVRFLPWPAGDSGLKPARRDLARRASAA